MPEEQPKKFTKSRGMSESGKVQENRAFIGSRTEVNSTTSTERQGTPRTTKKTS